MIVVF